MSKFFKEKVFSPFFVLLLILLAIAVTANIAIPYGKKKNQNSPIKEILTNETLYNQAVEDAMKMGKNDIHKLVTLTPNDSMTTWNGNGQVLLVTWTSTLLGYEDGESCSLTDRMWCYSEKELISWYKKNAGNLNGDLTTRFEQLLGLHENEGYTDFIAVWVDVKNVIRPAYNTNPTTNQMYTTLPENTSDMVKTFFEDQIYMSYYGAFSYPWTRLGYTYDWADNGTKYGVSEFMILKDSKVTVAYDKTNQEFFDYLKQKAKEE